MLLNLIFFAYLTYIKTRLILPKSIILLFILLQLQTISYAQQPTTSPTGGNHCAIVVDPRDTTVAVGDLATFTAVGSCLPSMVVYHKWKVSRDGGKTYNDIPGSQDTTVVGSSTLSFVATASDNGSKYLCYASIALDPIFANWTPGSPATLGVVNSLVNCPGSTIGYKTGFTADYYQWQVDAGTGYTSLLNDGTYAGVNTDSLSINTSGNISYGKRYRCLCTVPSSWGIYGNIVYSAVYTLKLAANWTGSVSSAWEDPANWSCCTLPDANTNITIPASASHFPELSTNTSVRNLKLNAPGTVTVKPGVHLTITH